MDSGCVLRCGLLEEGTRRWRSCPHYRRSGDRLRRRMGARQHDRLRAKQCLRALAGPGRRRQTAAVTALDPGRGEFSHRWPEILPNGKSVSSPSELRAAGRCGDRGADDRGKRSAHRRPGGHIPPPFIERSSPHTRDGVLYSRPFDGRREESGGQPVQRWPGSSSRATAPASSVSRAPARWLTCPRPQARATGRSSGWAAMDSTAARGAAARVERSSSFAGRTHDRDDDRRPELRRVDLRDRR